MSVRQDPERNHPLDSVLARAAVDREFRQQLLTDPRTAIERALGVHIPANFRIKFIERDASVDALVVLPDFKPPDGELSDDDLTTVAGGTEMQEVTWSEEFPEDLGDWVDPQ